MVREAIKKVVTRENGSVEEIEIVYNKDGFPDFSDYVHPTKNGKYSIQLTGNRNQDIKLANDAAGLIETPNGYTWHHTEDGKMQLVETAIHNTFPHTGGFALYK